VHVLFSEYLQIIEVYAIEGVAQFPIVEVGVLLAADSQSTSSSGYRAFL
jgi:hypothetical protein